MFSIDTMSRQPVYEQLIRQMEQFILAGVLLPRSQMPSVRRLSSELSVNPNTIQKAYAELDRRGVLCAVPGRGCFVSGSARQLLREYRRQELPRLEELARELRMAGVSAEEIRQAAERGIASRMPWEQADATIPDKSGENNIQGGERDD